MRIITHTCPDCGTIVAANELEERRVMKCPRFNCEAVFRFDELSTADRNHFLDNRDRYQL